MKVRINQEGDANHSAGTDLEDLQQDYTKNTEQVVTLLVNGVLSVNIEIPKVVKGDYEAKWNGIISY